MMSLPVWSHVLSCGSASGCAGRYWFLVAATEAGDTYPTGMHSCYTLNGTCGETLQTMQQASGDCPLFGKSLELSLNTCDFLRIILKEVLKVILLHLRIWKIPVTIPTASTNLIDNLKEPIAKHVNKTYEAAEPTPMLRKKDDYSWAISFWVKYHVSRCFI